MPNILKAIFALVLIIGVIVFGLFWPAQDAVKDDLFAMTESRYSYDLFPSTEPQPDFSKVLMWQTLASTKEQIRKGDFKFQNGQSLWHFTIPIDWAKPHEAKIAQQLFQYVVIADPFLESYQASGDIEDFRQAAFFFLDWQNFHQKSRKISPYAWDEKAAKGRAIRLAYILSMSNADRSLLEDNAVFSLMQLADFHVQRVTDPVYGAPYDMILSTPEFKALCTVVDLSACAHKR